jgi:hypothetical protein
LDKYSILLVVGQGRVTMEEMEAMEASCRIDVQAYFFLGRLTGHRLEEAMCRMDGAVEMLKVVAGRPAKP